jgi:restriction system protein
MAEKNRNSARRARQRAKAAQKLIVVGAVLALLPTLIPSAASAFIPTVLLGLLKLLGFGIVALACLAFLILQDESQGLQKTASDPRQKTAAAVAQPVQAAEHPSLPSALEKEFAKLPMRFAPYDGGAQQLAAPPTWSTQVLEEIEWRRFEAVVEALFQQMGFETQSQSHGADGGVDVWLYSRLDRSKAMSLVQCKHWHGKRAGVNLVRELRGIMASHGVGNGQFVCSGGFTPDAVAFARDNGIRLLDTRALLDLIAKRSAEQQQALLQVALEGEYWRPTCASCGIKLVERKPRNGGVPFWGCRNFPSCKSTQPIRTRPVAAGF